MPVRPHVPDRGVIGEVERIRSWRDRTRERYGDLPDGNEPPAVINARGWWNDVDTLLNEIDRLKAPPKTEEEAWSHLDRALQGIFYPT